MPTRPDVRASAQALIEVDALKVHFALQGSSLARLFGRDTGHVRAVDGVDLDLREGEVIGLVGESGSGKTTLGRALLGLVQPTGGRILYSGKDITGMGERDLRSLRTELQMVFQDPNAALNPAMTIAQQVGHPLRIHGLAKGRDDLRTQVSRALERVGLAPVERFLDKYPSDLSGGQKQRAVIARAIITGPRLLVADEPISMLDMSVRSKILQLMLDLKNDLGLTYVYITHDLASAKFFCDRVAIMYLGRIVEIGETAEIFRDPKHPYTKALLGAIPDPDPDRALPRDLPRGEIPDAAHPPSGCAFHPRCPQAFEVCGWEPRDLQTLLEEHWANVPVADYERERGVLGDLDGLDSDPRRAVLRPGSGSSVADVQALLERLRASDPDEPFWTGVQSVEDNAGEVVVTFRDNHDPWLRPASGVQVACHLFESGQPERP